jgi:hypothetical protein
MAIPAEDRTLATMLSREEIVDWFKRCLDEMSDEVFEDIKLFATDLARVDERYGANVGKPTPLSVRDASILAAIGAVITRMVRELRGDTLGVTA